MQEQMNDDRHEKRDDKRDYSAYNFKFYLEFAVVSFLCSLFGCALGFFISTLF